MNSTRNDIEQYSLVRFHYFNFRGSVISGAQKLLTF